VAVEVLPVRRCEHLALELLHEEAPVLGEPVLALAVPHGEFGVHEAGDVSAALLVGDVQLLGEPGDVGGALLQVLEYGEADLVGDLEEEVAESLHGTFIGNLPLKNVTLSPRRRFPICKLVTFPV
jgi:hypothetical protein